MFEHLLQVVNFGSSTVNLKITIDNLDSNLIQAIGSTQTILKSSSLMDENSFKEPHKVLENHAFEFVVLEEFTKFLKISCLFLSCMSSISLSYHAAIAWIDLKPFQ